MATFKPSSRTLLYLPLVMWKPQAHSQAPCVGCEVKGRFGEMVQGHTTVQLQFSRKSPAMCHRVCVEVIRHLHVVWYSSFTPSFRMYIHVFLQKKDRGIFPILANPGKNVRDLRFLPIGSWGEA